MLNSVIIRELKNILAPAKVLTGSNELVAYSYDAQPKSAMPDAVVLATQT